MSKRALVAEFLGTAFLLAGVVGSGIMAEQLTDDVGLQLFQNAFATALLLGALIITFGPISGAHFNPVVSLVDRLHGRSTTSELGAYVVMQVAGGVVGVVAANMMFGLAAISWSTTDRSRPALLFAEFVATVGLLGVIHGTARRQSIGAVAATVGAYIGAAYYFTASTSFANPAVTVARMFSDSFAGIAPGSAPGFVIAQIAAAAAAAHGLRWLFRVSAPPTDGADT